MELNFGITFTNIVKVIRKLIENIVMTLMSKLSKKNWLKLIYIVLLLIMTS